MVVTREEMKNLIINAVSSYHGEILEFTQALVGIPTENPPGRSYLTCVQAIASRLQEIGLETTMLEVPDSRSHGGKPYPRYCLLSFHGQGERTLYFHGHYDVVPASSPAQFRPYVQDGKLFGRGSSDMKGGLAAMIFAVKAIQACGIELGGRIGLTIVPDEETGGVLGAQYLSHAGLLGRDAIGMFLPEPTDGLIWNANRGAISLRVTVKGRQAHVCTHYEGRNAFEQMLVVADALLTLKREVERRKTRFQIEPEAARHSILLLGGRCEGGTNFNSVPDECSFTVDRRTNPEEDFEAEKKRLFKLFDRLRQQGIDLEAEILQEGGASGTSEDDPVVEVLAESVEDITGSPASFEMCPGFLETRFYAQLGIPALAYGPGILSISHGPGEFVRLQDIYDCTAIYALSAVRLLAPTWRPSC
jgi:acetylornithine deacetylase/succinyl-diaminopimelate desuccinylase family protein